MRFAARRSSELGSSVLKGLFDLNICRCWELYRSPLRMTQNRYTYCLKHQIDEVLKFDHLDAQGL